MNYPIPSHTATFKPTVSSVIGSLISLPTATTTATASILKTTDTSTASDHSYKTATNCFIDKMTTWIEIACMLLSIGFLIKFLISSYKMSKSPPQIRMPRYGNEDQAEKGGFNDHENTDGSQIWDEKYQNDASGMTGIRTLEQDSGNAVSSESIVDFGKEYVAKRNERPDSLKENLVTYCYYPSPLWEETMEEGRC